MKRMFNKWKNVSIAKKLFFVAGAMALLILGELLTLRFAMDKLAGTRAFIRGEGLWSKAQKNATICLHRYVETRDERDFQAFLDFLKVPVGDRQARLELLKKNPNMDLVRQGLLNGNNHVEDIDIMINILRRYSWVSFMARAIEVWTIGDQLLVEFTKVGNLFHAAMLKNDVIAANSSLTKIHQLNLELSAVEDEFSHVLGEGSRKLEFAVLGILSVIVFVVEAFGITLIFLISKSITTRLSQLNLAAAHFGRGDFSAVELPTSADEIGQLGHSLKAMALELETSYKNLEQRVQERTWDLACSRDQLDVILDGIRDGIAVVDSNLNFVYANHAAAKMCMYLSLEKFLESPFEKILDRFEIVRNDGSIEAIENYFLGLGLNFFTSPQEVFLNVRSKANFKNKWVLLKSSPILDQKTKNQLVVIILKDLTEIKRAEKNAKFLSEASKSLSSSIDLENILHSTLNLFVPKLADFCMISILGPNEEIRSIVSSGVALNQAKNIEHLKVEIQNKYRLDSTLGFKSISLEQGAISLGLKNLVCNHTQLNLFQALGFKSIVCIPLIARGGEIGNLMLANFGFNRKDLAADCSQLDEVAQRVSYAIDNSSLYKQAQEAIFLRDEFLSIASHELKTPLTSLSLRLQMTMKNLRPTECLIPPDKLVNVFEASKKQVDRLTNLVEDLLDVSRIQTGKFSFSFSHENLSELLVDMIERFNEQLNKAKCAISCNIQENVFGQFDHARLEQVIENLLSNVVKYAPGGPVFVSLRSNGSDAILEVSDRGPGIPLEAQSKIFDRFERVNSMAAVPGLGLGLFIVKEILNGHSASISLVSDRGLGSKFIIKLPLNLNGIEQLVNESFRDQVTTA